MARISALISTIQPIDGGVPSMTRWVCSLLEEYNIRPILSWYVPWKNRPDLSVPIYKVIGNIPKVIQERTFNNYDGFGIGSWLPELEFTHYLPTKSWNTLIKSCELHLCVSGNPLCATPYTLLQIPFIAWIATPWEADRRDRVRSFGLPRRTLDSAINKPILSKLEKRILRSDNGKIISLSKYTAKAFENLSGRRMSDVMLMPVNTNIFYPDYRQTVRLRVGFSGRYCDPRKNIELLLHATKILHSEGMNIELILVGEKDAQQLNPLIRKFQLEEVVICYGHMRPDILASLLKSLDVFVIPSFQEGLCISALEAMACGVPVISTRCGGPEEYVIPDETGILIDNSPTSLAGAITEICNDRLRRAQLSTNSSNWVKNNASEDKSRSLFKSYLIDLINRTKRRDLYEKISL